MSRPPRAASPLALLLGALLAALLIEGCAGAATPLRVPDVTLVDQRGEPLSLANLRGRPVVLTFFFARCDLTCPVYLATMASDLGDLGGDGEDVAVALVTVDPERDTPEEVARFAAAWPDHWRFLTGPPDRVSRVWRAYDIAVDRNEAGDAGRPSVAHSARLFVLDRQGDTVATLRGNWTRPQLRAAVADAVAGRQPPATSGLSPVLQRLLAECGEFASEHPWGFGALVVLVGLPGLLLPLYVLRALVRRRSATA